MDVRDSQDSWDVRDLVGCERPRDALDVREFAGLARCERLADMLQRSRGRL
jgi:hypothetical protein